MDARAARLERLVEVLSRTAADLTRIRDTERVLETICSRTRMLIDSDMAYISLNDMRQGQTYIRATDGVRTDAYRSIRMPLGTGVLGAAAGGARTFRTSDYAADGSLIHLPEVDDAVQQEGVRSILAAPLRIDGRVIGALLVAHREPREFTSEEQLIIESLAPQAAVAVENARLFEAQHEALENEKHARAEASLRLAQVQRLAQAEQAFSETLSRSAGHNALTAEVERVLSAPVCSFDSNGELIAGTMGDEGAMRAAAELVSAGFPSASAATASGYFTVARDGHRFAVALAQARGSTLGGFIVLVPRGRGALQGDDTETDSVILSRACSHLAALLLFQRTIDESRYRQERDLMSALTALNPGDDTRALARSLMQLSTGSVPPDEARTMLVIDIEQDRHPLALRTLRSSGLLSIVASHEGHVCGVYHGGRTSPAELRETLAPLKLDFVGGAAPFATLVDAAPAHREAQHLAQSLRRLGRGQEIVTRGVLGTAGLLAGAGAEGIVPTIIAEQLEPLRSYDAEHGTALLETCECWFESGRSIPETAGRLFVHGNTVRQRLERITSVLGSGWADGSRALELHLALRLHRLSARG